MDPYLRRDMQPAVPIIQEQLRAAEEEAAMLLQTIKERGAKVDTLSQEQKRDSARHTVVVAEGNALRRVLNELTGNRL